MFAYYVEIDNLTICEFGGWQKSSSHPPVAAIIDEIAPIGYFPGARPARATQIDPRVR
jgi:hypothetical protein